MNRITAMTKYPDTKLGMPSSKGELARLNHMNYENFVSLAVNFSKFLIHVNQKAFESIATPTKKIVPKKKQKKQDLG